MLDNIYNSYLTGDERLEAIEEAKQEALLDKLCTMYEMVDMNLRLNLKDAEIKVFEESGTYDDLQFLYEEAQAEANQQKEGIFSKIIEGVQKLINTILNGIKNFFNKSNEQNADEIVEVDNSLIEDHNNVLHWWDKVKNWFSQNVNKAKMVALVGGTALVVSTVVGVKKIKRSEAGGMVGHLRDIITKIEDSVKSVTNKFQGKIADGISWLINTVVIKGLGFIKQLINKISMKIGCGSVFSQKDIDGTSWKEKQKSKKRKKHLKKVVQNTINNRNVNTQNNNQGNNTQPVNNNQNNGNNNNNSTQPQNESVEDTTELLGFNIFSESENDYLENENADNEINELADLFSDL